MIREISTQSLTDARQIGWIAYQEGDAILRVKVIRKRDGDVFLSHQTSYRAGVVVKTVTYADKTLWFKKADYMLNEFRRNVGEDYWENFRNDSKT